MTRYCVFQNDSCSCWETNINIFKILLKYVHLVNGLRITNVKQPRVQTVLAGSRSLLTLKKLCGRNRKRRLIEACEENASVYLITASFA